MDEIFPSSMHHFDDVDAFTTTSLPTRNSQITRSDNHEQLTTDFFQVLVKTSNNFLLELFTLYEV